MLILPDSSCWIEFFRPHGDPRVRSEMQAWLAADAVALCGPVRAEVIRGASKRDAGKVQRAFSALHYFETRDADWETVAEKARLLSDGGNHVPLLDILIATIAEREGATLAHRDTHFHAIAEVLPVAMRGFA